MSGFGKDELFRSLEEFLADQHDPRAREKIIQDALEKFGVSAELIAAAKDRFCVSAPPTLAPPRFNVDLGSNFEVGHAAHFEFHLICPGYRDKPKVTAKLRLLDQDTWEGAPSLSTEEPGYWIFGENFFLTKGGQPCPPGTYGIELAVEFRSAPANSLGRFLRASLKIQVHDPRSKPDRTLEIDGEGLSIINLQGHDLRGFSHVKLKGGDKSVVNLHRGAAEGPPQSEDSPSKPSAVDRYYQLPLKVDHDRTDDRPRLATSVPTGPALNRLMFSFADGRRVLVFAQDCLRLGRNRDRGNDIVLRCVPRSPDHDRKSLNLSKEHCQIFLTPQGVCVRDLGTSLGTALNEQRLTSERPHPLAVEYDGHVQRLLLADSFELALRLFAAPEAPSASRLQMCHELYAEAVESRVEETWEKAAAAAVEAVRIERRSNLPSEEYVLLFRQAWLGTTDDCALRLPLTIRRTRAARVFYLGRRFWLERLDDSTAFSVDGREPSLRELWPLFPGQVLVLDGDEVRIGEAMQDLGESALSSR